MCLGRDKVPLSGLRIAGTGESATIRERRGRSGKMKLTMERVGPGEEEMIVRYTEMTGQIQTIIGIVQGTGEKIKASCDERIFLFNPEDIFYLESVDGGTYAYSKDRVGKVSESLESLAMRYERRGFFRCSKHI